MRILAATTNQGKLAELELILSKSGIEIIGLSKFEPTEKLETASTFAENAVRKARYYHRLRGLPTIADDSGLEVEALAGGPGVFSARYAGPEAGDAIRIARLLDDLREVPAARRGAKFVCAAAIVWQGGQKVFISEVAGEILTGPRGESGFGYDPVFFYRPLGKTFAELTPAEKAEVSHRGGAFRQLAAWLADSGALDTQRSGDRIVPTAD